MDGPEISVIEPVFNVKPYISKCLNSLLNQSFDNYEIIIIDDGSTGSTLSICNKYLNTLNKIKIVDQENVDISFILNLDISVSNGEFISLVDDDYVDTAFLSLLHKTITKTESRNLSMCYLEKDYYEGIMIKDITRPTFAIEKIMDGGSFCHTSIGMIGALNLMTNNFLRKSLFDCFLFEGAVYENSKIASHLAKRTNSIVKIPNILYFLHLRASSIAYVTNEIMLRFLNTCIFYIKNFIQFITYKMQKSIIAHFKKRKLSGGVIISADCFCYLQSHFYKAVF